MTKRVMNASSIPTRECTRWRKSVASSPDAAMAPTVAARSTARWRKRRQART
jgi:hypothetical protein